MKEYTCICGSKRFRMVETVETVVDFSKEGAVGGHPFLGGRHSDFALIRCTECNTRVPVSVAAEMRKEII